MLASTAKSVRFLAICEEEEEEEEAGEQSHEHEAGGCGVDGVSPSLPVSSWSHIP